MQVWKFSIGVGTGEQHVQMPTGARVLSVQLQDGMPQLWAVCDPTAAKVLRRIVAMGTGDDGAPADAPYIDTLQVGYAVLHYFDLGERQR